MGPLASPWQAEQRLTNVARPCRFMGTALSIAFVDGHSACGLPWHDSHWILLPFMSSGPLARYELR